MKTRGIFFFLLLTCIAPPLASPGTTQLPQATSLALTRENYQAVLQLVDLSNAIANEQGYFLKQSYPTEKEIPVIRARIQNIIQWLKARGWRDFSKIPGKTGRNNVESDITAIVHSHPSQRLIVVAFHGSRSGSKNPLHHDGRGDWGANFDLTPVSPSEAGIEEMPDFVRIQRGFANNLASARPHLLTELNRRVKQMGSFAPIWIWVTGHSKGGALAGLSAGMIKTYFQQRGWKNVNVGGIFFSAPPAFQGELSQKWIHDLVGRTNLLRINVHGDPVPIVPARFGPGYRSIGVLILDSVQAVHHRSQQLYGITQWIAYHYLCGARGIGYEFDPNLVMNYAELAHGLEQGLLHTKKR